jgi:HEAT repeat protein
MSPDMDALAQRPMKRARKRAKRACLILFLAVLMACGFYVNYLMQTGNDWLIHRVATLTPSHLKAEYLASRLNSPDPAKAADAERAILALRNKAVIKALVRYAGETDPGLNGRGRRICDLVARIGEPAFEPLLEAARESPVYLPWEPLRLWFPDLCERKNERMFRASRAVDIALHSIGKPAIAPATRLLETGDAWQKQQAVGILGQNGDAEAVRALVAYVPLASGGQKTYAVTALTWQHSPLAVETFLDVIKQEDGFGAWKQAAIGLGYLQDSRAVPCLLKLAADPDADMRLEAVSCLGSFPAPEATAALLNALCDHKWAVRQAAAECLGECADESAWRGLCNACNDTDKDVRTAAKNALTRIQARARKTASAHDTRDGRPAVPASTPSVP